MAREKKSEKREEREREGNVIPPLSPLPDPPHCDGHDAGCIYHSPTRQVHIMPPPSHLSIIDFPQQPCLGSPSQVKLQSTEKVGITQKKDLKRSGNLIDPASPYLTTNKKDR